MEKHFSITPPGSAPGSRNLKKHTLYMGTSKTTHTILIKFTYVVVLVELVISLVHNFLIRVLLLGVIGVQNSKYYDFHQFSPLNNSVTVFSYGTKLTYRIVLSLGNNFLVHNFLIGALLLGVIGVRNSKFNDLEHLLSPVNETTFCCNIIVFPLKSP